MPKLSKVAWRLRPSHGFSSEHSERGQKREKVLEAGCVGEEGEGREDRELCVVQSKD